MASETETAPTATATNLRMTLMVTPNVKLRGWRSQSHSNERLGFQLVALHVPNLSNKKYTMERNRSGYRCAKKTMEPPPSSAKTPAYTAPPDVPLGSGKNAPVARCKRMRRINEAFHVQITTAPKPQLRSTTFPDYRNTSTQINRHLAR